MKIFEEFENLPFLVRPVQADSLPPIKPDFGKMLAENIQKQKEAVELQKTKAARQLEERRQENIHNVMGEIDRLFDNACEHIKGGKVEIRLPIRKKLVSMILLGQKSGFADYCMFLSDADDLKKYATNLFADVGLRFYSEKFTAGDVDIGNPTVYLNVVPKE